MCDFLAGEMVAGRWRDTDLRACVTRLFKRPWKGLDAFIVRMMNTLGWKTRPLRHRVTSFLWNDPPFHETVTGRTRFFRRDIPEPTKPLMWPAATLPMAWNVPEIVEVSALAERLGLGLLALDWLADCGGYESHQTESAHPRYQVRFVPKRHGGVRVIEAPCGTLRYAQREVLRSILMQIPPHDAAHGFRPGRSVRSYVEPHVCKRVVIKLDIQDFFPSITAARVRSLFMRAGYPEDVARTLAGLTTNRISRGEFRGRDLSRQFDTRKYEEAHLPQGAPTSPALANLCAFRLDMRLAGLAAASGGVYTRYADDLAFSGDDSFARGADRFVIHVMAIALEEGFAIQPRKTRVMRSSIRQRVAGVVINEWPNIARDEYDRLKATLHNCVKFGPESQNRERVVDFRQHLKGRVSYVNSLNPGRGDRLKGLFEQICWVGEG